MIIMVNFDGISFIGRKYTYVSICEFNYLFPKHLASLGVLRNHGNITFLFPEPQTTFFNSAVEKGCQAKVVAYINLLSNIRIIILKIDLNSLSSLGLSEG